LGAVLLSSDRDESDRDDLAYIFNILNLF
jgi:hypothetical protein